MAYLLVVSQQLPQAPLIEGAAAQKGFEVNAVDDVKRALVRIQQRKVDVLVLEVAVFMAARELIVDLTQADCTQIITITAYATPSIKEQAQTAGTIPVVLQHPEHRVAMEATLSRLAEKIHREHYAAHLAEAEYDYAYFIGRSPHMLRLYDHLEKVAKTDIPVLIIGESGTGKELAALAIHSKSLRHKENFLALNCGAISTTLIESELFGHEKGSFTGAERSRQGYFELTDQGTLFLDEVTEMSMEMQVRLLRVLETRQFMRVGGTKMLSSNARIVAATNRNPQRAVDENELRNDLYYRLNVIPIQMPPLRERGDDIWLLANNFLAQMNRQHHTEKYLDPSLEATLLAYNWPGNVRELRNVIWRHYVLADEECIQFTL